MQVFKYNIVYFCENNFNLGFASTLIITLTS